MLQFMQQMIQQNRDDNIRRDEQMHQQRRAERAEHAETLRAMTAAFAVQSSQYIAALAATTAQHDAIADKPVAVISNKSDAKITEHRHVASIKGIFASDASFIETFQVEDQVGIPVPDTAAAFQSFRRLIKTHCQTNTPDLSDAQIMSAMFV